MWLVPGERQTPAWVGFPVSPSPCPAVSYPSSTAPAVQPKVALGLWWRWHGKTEVPLLLQHHPMEQTGGLGRMSWQVLSRQPLSLALVTPGDTGSSVCWRRFAWKGYPRVGYA